MPANVIRNAAHTRIQTHVPKKCQVLFRTSRKMQILEKWKSEFSTKKYFILLAEEFKSSEAAPLHRYVCIKNIPVVFLSILCLKFYAILPSRSQDLRM